MGGAVSAGQNNNELVDNLCYENYIQTPEVELVRMCSMVGRVGVHGLVRPSTSAAQYKCVVWYECIAR